MPAPRVILGSLVLEPGRGLVAPDGAHLPLGQRALAVLEALAAAGGAVVTKAELMERVWPGQIVEEGNLTVQVASLRKALGVTPDGRDWIVTVPRVGYRLAPAARPEPAAAFAHPMPPRLAVHGFDAVSGDDRERELADGVSSELVTALARFRSFTVVSAAARDDAAYRLDGTVQRVDSRLRIHARLSETRGGRLLVAERFDGTLADIFDFQDRLAERVAVLIDPAIEGAEMERSRRERPGSLAAYDIYLRALAKLMDETEAANAEANALLEQALEREPGNPQFLALAAWVLEHRIAMGWPRLTAHDRERCVELARRGYGLANGDARVMLHCGMALLQAGRDYEAGVAAVTAAFGINPNDLMVASGAGIATMHCGDLDEAEDMLRRAVALGASDPDARFAMTGLAMICVMRGDHHDALSWASRSLAINARFDATYWMMIAANAHLGRIAEAREWLGRLRAIAPGATLASIRDGQPAKHPDRIGAVLDGLQLVWTD